MKTVAQLRREGWKVRVSHYRWYHDVENDIWDLLPKYEAAMNPVLYDVSSPDCCGGKTIVEISTPDGVTSVVGTAECSDVDNFNKKLGVRMAIGRAMKQLEMEK